MLCLGAGIVEFVLLVANPGGQDVLPSIHAGIVTSFVCVVAGAIGLFQKPRTIWTVVCGLGVLVGMIAFAFTAYIEVIVAAFTSGL